jgi:endonuclease YncB( thermonuclease family)
VRLAVGLALALATACAPSSDGRLPEPDFGGVVPDAARPEPPPEADGPALDAPEPDLGPTFPHTARVSYPVDGDTIVVEFLGAERTVRLRGINTPEIEPVAEPWGPEAQAFTRNASPSGRRLGLEFDDEACAEPDGRPACFDPFGRLLAYARLARNDADLGAELLVHGLARVFADDFARREEYDRLQAEAQAAGVGMWSAE